MRRFWDVVLLKENRAWLWKIVADVSEKSCKEGYLLCLHNMVSIKLFQHRPQSSPEDVGFPLT